MDNAPHKTEPLSNIKHVLLHSCCAPCSGAIIEQLKKDALASTVLFYNPNIQPEAEYLRRKKEQLTLAEKMGVPFVDMDYDPDNWRLRVKGLENEPERGKRCAQCFSFRLEKAAAYAHQNNFKIFTSTLGISRWKDMDQVNACGLDSASKYPGLTYWTYNWRKKGGSQRMHEIAKEHQLYQQHYCGCIFSQKNV